MISTFNLLYLECNLSAMKVSRLTKDKVLMRLVKDRLTYDGENKGRKGISENMAYEFCHCEAMKWPWQSLSASARDSMPRRSLYVKPTKRQRRDPFAAARNDSLSCHSERSEESHFVQVGGTTRLLRYARND